MNRMANADMKET